MSARLGSPTAVTGEPYTYPASWRPGRRWSWWLVPLVIFGGLWTAFAVAWALGWLRGAPGFPYPWPFFPFGFFLPLLLIFLVFRWAFWGWGGRGRGWYATPSAEDVLRLRYARGEISAEQFREMSRELERK